MAFATFGRFQFFIRTDDRGCIEVGVQCRTRAEGVWAVCGLRQLCFETGRWLGDFVADRVTATGRK